MKPENHSYRDQCASSFSLAPFLLAALIAIMLAILFTARSMAATVEANQVVEVPLVSKKNYENAFMDVQMDAVVTQPDGKPLRVPGFWAGGTAWRFRYASEKAGTHSWQVECSDTANAGLHGVKGSIEVVATKSTNPLFLHGPIRVAADHRHFEHADGTPFLWLSDTWWKCLAKRLPWEGFQELTADRKAKGFNVVQIVCGPYPDEGGFEARWENEGGKPYLTRQFTEVNSAYFEFADRRFKHVVDSGMVAAIVGGWGRGDCDGLKMAGVDGMKRHWRNLIARYGAYPTIWIIGGESGGPQWTEVARYVQKTDPYHRPATIHPAESGRKSVTDETVISFDMLQTGHGGGGTALGAIPKFAADYAMNPPMPVLIGEHSYEGHMQTGFQDDQRYVFWSSMLSGAAGLTYGAAGIWNAGVEGDPGHSGGSGQPYDWTTWKEGMGYPGSAQVGMGKKLLEKYPWHRFEPHPEWTSEGFAAGIPGELVYVYVPKRGIYDWNGFTVEGLTPGMPYSAFFFDPATGRRFDKGIVTTSGTWNTPNLPSPQDWVLVIQALKHSEPMILPNVAVGKTCSGQLAPAGATFAKVAGPGWLTIKPDGSFTGTPDEPDSGAGSWLVSTTKDGSETTFIHLQIKVVGTCLLAENFSSYRGTQNNTQYQSGLKVAYNGSAVGWTRAGAGTMHAVDRGGPSNARNWAVMIYQDNVITSGAIAANISGQAYRVAFETSAAVYAASYSEQATQAGDALRIEVLRGNSTVLATHTRAPGAWAGKMVFTADGFQYTGDGTGDVRLRIGPAGALTSGRFQGAIDNIMVKKESAP